MMIQIAGSTCKSCGKRIVIADEGMFCAQCGTAVHRECAVEPLCDICGQPYQRRVSSEADPRADACVPRALRPTGSEAPIGIAILLAASALLLVAVMFYLMMLA